MRWVKGKRLRTRDSGHKPKNAQDLIVRREGWGFTREWFILRSELQVFFKRCWPVFMRSVNSVHFFGWNASNFIIRKKLHVVKRFMYLYMLEMVLWTRFGTQTLLGSWGLLQQLWQQWLLFYTKEQWLLWGRLSLTLCQITLPIFWKLICCFVYQVMILV